ncbi:receptor-type tyrosine-protein phosphatase S-like isoform X1 [Mya arenaria]|uniref:receptor-type tyrosine-protein phosphatase S-like isoform X1 n=1 Tax=Mya arenaria TaxID=6604 RepID=UPI0022DF5582|nr:receptor-type tyrosine-protein phosphatase S-like isoform X1 [Mya arenaria]
MHLTCMINGYIVILLTIVLELVHKADAGELRDLMHRCPDGSFGYKCKFRCRCRDDEPCDKFSGSCYNGCAPGFWGPGCQLSNMCFYNGQPHHYAGRVNSTKNLFACQRWDAQIPHRHSYGAVDFPDGLVPENFCRTTKDSSKPWCYTTDHRKRWDNCQVNNCNCPAGRFGDNCERECHCRDQGERCDSIMGICKTKCGPGWTGFDCQTPQSCPGNLFGWECSEQCYCQDPLHCDRFTGPTDRCRCRQGYFNAPYCEPVTPPRILGFTNEQVNQGQSSVFNCSVAAFPTPRDDEIRLVTPSGKHVTLIQSNVHDGYTRSSLFLVTDVQADERFSCVVRAVAGETSITRAADLFRRPMLISPPTVLKEEIGATEVPLTWPPWSRHRGDSGDGPVMWYSVFAKGGEETEFRMASVVPEVKCHENTMCNYTLLDLTPNTNYVIYVSVRRQGDTTDGPASPMANVKTKCAEPTEGPTIISVDGGYQVNKTYPLTRLLVEWQDSLAVTWGCDNIRRYQILVSSGDEPSTLVTHVAGRAHKEFYIRDLEPGTSYCVRVKYENNGGHFSPASPMKCVTTPATVLSAPRNLRMTRRTSESLTFTWERPQDTRVNLTTYTIIYWKGFVRELSTKKGLEWESAEAEVEYTLGGLEADTSYNIQIQAVNSAGAGEYSTILTTSTGRERPGMVTRFRNISRTLTSVMLKWDEPEDSAVQILFYYVHCVNVRKLLAPDTEPFRIPSKMTSFNYTGLRPSLQYKCTINASTSTGTGPTSYLLMWTLSVDPSDPPAPTILGRSETTVTLEIKPHDDETVSYYRIIVESLSERSRRSVQDDDVTSTSVDYYTATREGLSMYVAAQLTDTAVVGTFVVGDNRTYGGFTNVPLESDVEYDIWLCAFAETDTGIRKSTTKAVKGAVERGVPTAAPTSNHVPVIVGVLIVFIVMILVVALLLFVWRKKKLQSEREKAEMPNFGPTIIPEPELTPPSTPIDTMDVDPLLGAARSGGGGHVSDTDSEPVYGNIGFEILSVRVEDLWDYVKNNKCNDCEGFKREYKLIPCGVTALCEAARKDENKSKNRYGNIVAYDHTRVVLHDIEEKHEDYINANYIDGYSKEAAYIAAQGPTKETLKDIWRMVWQEKSRTIIMLTNPTETGKKKCESYWPNDDTENYHDITVEHMSTYHLPDFTTRTFKLTKEKEVRLVKQFHYTAWPDHGVPAFSNSLLLLRQKIRSHDNLEAGPQVIHCSAGVGRTGSYIAIDVELERAKTEGKVDVHNFVQLMRTQRINMVQTLDQYIFVYDCLLEALISGDTLMLATEYKELLADMCQFDNNIQKTRLEEQFDILRLITTSLERKDSTVANKPENMFKNRCKNILPANRYRPFLMTPYEGCNDYINAVFTNSYTLRDGFILTQMPLPNTVIDFWRLVYDHCVSAIVMLNDLEPQDETVCQYWSLSSTGEKYGPFIVETTAEIISDPSITIRDFTITNTYLPQVVPKVVRQFQFHRWSSGSPVPSSKLALFELIDMVDKSQKQAGDQPVLVHCMNGASRSGLYVAVSVLVERLKLEKEIDVFQTVKQLRQCRPHLVDNLEQYRYCHEIVLDYINKDNADTPSIVAPTLINETLDSEMEAV